MRPVFDHRSASRGCVHSSRRRLCPTSLTTANSSMPEATPSMDGNDWHHFTKHGIQLLAFIEVPACLPELHRKGDMTTRAVGSRMRDGRGTAKKAAD